MEVQLKYGRESKQLIFPDTARVSLLRPAGAPVIGDIVKAFEEAMSKPLDAPRLDRMRPPRTVAIAISDESRPTPTKALLPPLLEKLYRAFADLRADDVTIIVAAGLHPPLNAQETARLLPPDAAPGCRVVSHDAVNDPMRDYGKTSRGTPVLINEAFARADLRIVIGNVDPHQFVGFTGGAKGAVIGCGARATIEVNHSLMFHDKAVVANIEGNPVRMDIDEAGRRIGVHLAINVVMDASNRVVKLAAGEPVAVYQAGAKVCAQIYGVPIKEKYDIAVASCGGHPKDICLYQAQKGLAHAAQAVKTGGKILLLAACPQGVGDDVYLDYVSRFPTPQAALDDFKCLGFKMGAHKAFLFARTLVRYDVAMVSELDSATLARCHFAKADAQETVTSWMTGTSNPSVAVIPNANSTYFALQSLDDRAP